MHGVRAADAVRVCFRETEIEPETSSVAWRLAHDGIVPEGVQMRPA
jgi:hypothetical protein